MRVFSLLVSLAALASAEDFLVMVGENHTLTYNPSSVNAQSGDSISFRFVSGNHTVTQSTFANPCESLTSPSPGINSGYMPVAANASTFPQWTITLQNVSAPLWFFCAKGSHCKAGMVFALNPTGNETFAAFHAAAMASTSDTNSTSSGSDTGAMVPSASGITTSLTTVSGSGASPTQSSASGNSSSRNGGVTSMNVASTGVSGSVALVLGLSIFLM